MHILVNVRSPLSIYLFKAFGICALFAFSACNNEGTQAPPQQQPPVLKKTYFEQSIDAPDFQSLLSRPSEKTACETLEMLQSEYKASHRGFRLWRNLDLRQKTGQVDLLNSPMMLSMLGGQFHQPTDSDILSIWQTDAQSPELQKKFSQLERPLLESLSTLEPSQNILTQAKNWLLNLESVQKRAFLTLQKKSHILVEWRTHQVLPGVFVESNEPIDDAYLFKSMLKALKVSSDSLKGPSLLDFQKKLTRKVSLFESDQWKELRTEIPRTLRALKAGQESQSTEERLCSFILQERVQAQLVSLQGYERPEFTHLSADLLEKAFLPPLSKEQKYWRTEIVPGPLFSPIEGRAAALPIEASQNQWHQLVKREEFLLATTRPPRLLLTVEEGYSEGSLTHSLDFFEALSFIFSHSSREERFPSVQEAKENIIYRSAQSWHNGAIDNSRVALTLIAQQWQVLRKKFLRYRTADGHIEKNLKNSDIDWLLIVKPESEASGATTLHLEDLLSLARSTTHIIDALSHLLKTREMTESEISGLNQFREQLLTHTRHIAKLISLFQHDSQTCWQELNWDIYSGYQEAVEICGVATAGRYKEANQLLSRTLKLQIPFPFEEKLE